MFGSQKSSARRQAIREHRPDTSAIWFKELQSNGTFPSIAIAAVFWILASAILMLRQDVLPYQVGQIVRHDIISRADFSYVDTDVKKREEQQEAHDRFPHVYRSTVDAGGLDAWQSLQQFLFTVPMRVAQLNYDQLPADLKPLLDPSSLAALKRYKDPELMAHEYQPAIEGLISEMRRGHWVIIPADQKAAEINDQIILVPGDQRVDVKACYTIPPDADLKAQIRALTPPYFRLGLRPNIEALILANLKPNFELDPDQSALAATTAGERVPDSAWTLQFRKNQPFVHKDEEIDAHAWRLLQAENRAYNATLDGEAGWKSKVGIALVTLLMTIALATYTAHFQPKVVTNHARAIAIVMLLLSMLLCAQLAGMGSGPTYLLAVVFTLLVGMILAIAYDQRFATGIASIQAILVTFGLDQRIGFLVTLWVGLVFSCFMLSDIRNRSRLIEVGGVAAVAMMVATAAWGLISLDDGSYIFKNCLYAGGAGLSAGFVVLGILPFIEKAFRITTSMTLLELADASHPLLRRLALEAPGTYSHSLQVATLAEAAAEAIGANSLLCRVAAYYHDVGKINKPDYFVENQQLGQQNRHVNLTPNVSFLIIKGHVMDGLEMAREYTLPTSIFPFVQQHHGTTLVEYFYHSARLQQEKNGDCAEVNESDFRYPGPKPRSREVGILMLADCAESATRSMAEPTAARIENLVHELTSKRLADGQFDDSELTMKELNRIEQSLTKTLLSIYHGRLAYPSTAKLTTAPVAKMTLVRDEVADGTA